MDIGTVRELMAWWSQQMLDLLPRGLAQRDDTPANALIATDLGGVAELSVRHSGSEQLIGRFGLDEAGIRLAREALASHRVPRHVVLRVRADILLEEGIVLPLVAEPELERVLLFEMDRWTPFKASELYWNWSVERRDRRQGRLHVHLCMVPKAPVQAITDLLLRLNTPVTMVQATAMDGSRSNIGVQHTDARPLRVQRRMLTLAASVCVTLALLAAMLPFIQQSVALSRTEARIETLKPQVVEAEKLRRMVLQAASADDAISLTRRRQGEVLQTLAAITDVLPDDTYLLNLSRNRTTLRIDGKSTGAARLITLLAAVETLHNPRFAAPVVRNEGGSDVFSIQADIGR